jgi:2-amino-4-hydroxy-6-hydroxymethyldihydropteridine diphosphokinase
MGCHGHNVLPPSGVALVGVGSNAGDREDNLMSAARQIAKIPGVLALKSSPVYETIAVGDAGPDNFLNAVFQLSVRISPTALFEHLREVEENLGRRPPRSGPRPIDLDLLFYDDLVLQTETLTLPHPRLHLRAFVLEPLADLVPGFCHPEFDATVADLLEALDDDNGVLGQVGGELTVQLSGFSN